MLLEFLSQFSQKERLMCVLLPVNTKKVIDTDEYGERIKEPSGDFCRQHLKFDAADALHIIGSKTIAAQCVYCVGTSDGI